MYLEQGLASYLVSLFRPFPLLSGSFSSVAPGNEVQLEGNKNIKMYSFVLCLLAAVQAASASATQTCKTLDAKIPGRVSYPDSTAYNASISSYYSGQERDLNPGCIFRPTSTAEVSQFIKLVTSSGNTQFAVRGGGHTLWPGAANVNGGITVDMRAMNNLTLSKDHKIAHLGAGAVFSDIYPQLVPYNLTVMGGRVPGIGAGGFVTGGRSLRRGLIQLQQWLTRDQAVSRSCLDDTALAVTTSMAMKLFSRAEKSCMPHRVLIPTFGLP